MRPFNHRPSREEQDLWERSDRDFGLRAVHPEEEHPSPTFSTFPQREDAYPQDKHEIRNMGFFKEQERQFTQNEEEEEWEERQSPINFVLVISLLVILSVVGWFGYRWANSSTNSEPPFIAAEPTPFKVKPENPGGMVIPHQDKLVYGRIAPDANQPVEHLLPAPEQPMAPVPQGQPQTFVDANGQMYYAYPVPQEAYVQQGMNQPHGQPGMYQEGYQTPQVQAPAMQSAPMAVAPQPQQSVAAAHPAPALQPAGQVIAPAPQSTQPVASLPQAQGQAAAVSQQPIQPTQQVAAPLQPQQLAPTTVNPTTPPYAQKTAPASGEAEKETAPAAAVDHTLDQLIEQELGTEGSKPATTEPKSEPEKVATEAKQKASGGTYKIQVATLATKAEAEAELKRIKAIDPALFANKSMTIQKLELANKKSSYRVVVGSFATPNAAAQFSNKLKIHKVKGIVLNQQN